MKNMMWKSVENLEVVVNMYPRYYFITLIIMILGFYDSVIFIIGIKWSEFASTDLYLFLYVAIADWFWVVKWTCIGILGGVWMASRQKNRLLRVSMVRFVFESFVKE